MIKTPEAVSGRAWQIWQLAIRSVLLSLLMLAVLVPAPPARATEKNTVSKQGKDDAPTLTLPGNSSPGKRRLRILTKRIEPFVFYHDGKFSGFSVDLWELIASHEGLSYEWVLAPTLKDLLNDIKQGRADAAVAAVSITEKREKFLDFSHPFFQSGLQIMTRQDQSSATSTAFSVLWSLLSSPSFIYTALSFLLALVIIAHVIWWVERRRNPSFSQDYPKGAWDAFWWAIVTATSVGYGDKVPLANWGRFIAILWMILGYFIFAYFTATVTSSITVRELQGAIRGPQDLPGHKVGVVAHSTSARFMAHDGRGALVREVDRLAQALEALLAGKIDAIVHDSPVLLYHATHSNKEALRVTGPVFHKEAYGIVFPEGSKLREPVNRALLAIMENGEYARLHDKWFGPHRP